MINLKSIKKLIPLLLLAINNPIFAAAHESGAYIDGNVGVLYQAINIFGYHYGEFSSVGVNVNGGYQFNRYLATEVGYTNYAGSLNALDAALKVILPFSIKNNDFSVFAKIGPALVISRGESEVWPLAGLGASYAVSEKMDVSLQAQGITNGFLDLALISAGLTYHFG